MKGGLRPLFHLLTIHVSCCVTGVSRIYLNTAKVFLCAVLLPFLAGAQTSNDLSSGIRQLEFGVQASSSTTNNTVERSCVDEKLTGQCIQYHNDQWFSYVPPTSSPFYINVRHERCKNDRGVQLVVFTGELCQTETYRIVSCNSPASASDFYFKVERPEAGTTYFMIIDGYLGDFCDFTIEVAGRANGLPVVVKEPLSKGATKVVDKVVHLQWQYLPDTIEASYFAVRRSSSAADEKRWVVPVSHNSRGGVAAEYFLADTLSNYDRFLYRVFLVDANNEHHPFFKRQVVSQAPQQARIATTAFFPFAVKKKTNLQVTITDTVSGRVLRSRYVEGYKLEGLYYDFQEEIKRGHYYFDIKIYDYKSQRTEVFKKRFDIPE